MTIVEVASEVAPFCKTGGLGDVLGALPKEIARQGHRVALFMPYYRDINVSSLWPQQVPTHATVRVNGTEQPISLHYAKDKRTRTEFYFVGNPTYFDRPGFYQDPQTGHDYADNAERFSFFVLAVLTLTRELRLQPDIFHVHDWQTALLPVYLKTVYSSDPILSRAKSVLTIHNMAYQGRFHASQFPVLGLPDSLFYATEPLEFFGDVNFLKGGIHFADKVTTVSETYAHEIQSSPELGVGLDGVLRGRSADVVGILNGVDYQVWSPSRDKLLPYTYYLANLSGKQKNKVELLNQIGLPVREKAPLIGIISRLVEQKGFDLVEEALDELLNRNIQMVVLGSGEERYRAMFLEAEKRFPDKVRAFIQFDETLAHRIEASADIFLMPSRFEPCGLNQMYSLKYGTIPIVHRVGGLADTIVDYDDADGEGTGFVFSAYDSQAMLAAVDRAISLFERRKKWITLMKQAMRADFSWKKSSQRYIRLFESLITH